MAPKKQSATASKAAGSKPVRKRTSNPGVRVVNGRIYDSENGTCCHQMSLDILTDENLSICIQNAFAGRRNIPAGSSIITCHQKTRDFSVRCKNRVEDKQCSLHYCHKCLLNRYGENAEKMAAKADWKCPKCRGFCNCSSCWKKQGYPPVGNKLRSAKERGFACVSEMLQSEEWRKNAALVEETHRENVSNGKSISKSKYSSEEVDVLKKFVLGRIRKQLSISSSN